jgi:hypothetical protein
VLLLFKIVAIINLYVENGKGKNRNCERDKMEEYAKLRDSFISSLAENYSGTEQCSLAWVMRKESVNPL